MEGACRCIDGGDHSVKTQRESEVMMEEEKYTTAKTSTTGGDAGDEGDVDGDTDKELRSPVAGGRVHVSGAAESKEDTGGGHTGGEVDIVQGSEGETLTGGDVEAVSHLTPDVCHGPAAPEASTSGTMIGSGVGDKSLQTGNASDSRCPDSCHENTVESDAVPERLTQSDMALGQTTEGESEETTPVESDTVVEEASQKEIDIKDEETIPIDNDSHKEETLPKETDPTMEDRSHIESDIRTEETTPRENYTNAEETTQRESDRHGEETAPVVSDINTAEITQIENDICVKETITTEDTSPTKTDTCIEETPPIECVSLEEEAIPVQDENYVEETTVETDIGAKETKPVKCDTCAEETTTPESDIRAEETTTPESDIRAEETTPESDIRAEETTTPESDIRAEETTTPESDIRAEETTPQESDIRAEETTTPESDIRAEETTTPESDIRAEETTPESDIRAEETTTPESDIRAEETTTPESDIRAEETTPQGSDIRAEETTPQESDIRAEETTPQGSDIRAEETTPQGSDIRAEERRQQGSDIRAEETTPQGSDIRAEETTPIESDTFIEDTTIIESDTHVDKTTPTTSDTATEETTPTESDNHLDEMTHVESGTKETKPTENDIQLAETTVKESDICAKETTPTESDTNTEKTTPLIKSVATLEETTPTQTDISAEETPPQESDNCAEETTPIVSDTYTEETESETHTDVISSQQFLDDSYTEESDTVSEYPATTESSETLSSSGFEEKYKVTDATPDAEQKPSGSKKQTPDEDAARETSSNEGQSSPNDTRTREISKTVSYKEKKSSSSDVTTEQVVEEAVTEDDGITVRSHEAEEERHQTEQEESIDMKASVVIVGGIKMEDEERSVRYEEAESMRKETKTEEEIVDTDGTVVGRCRSKYTQHTHSSDSHSVSSRRTALSTDDPTDARDTPDPSQASTTLSEDGITLGGVSVLSDISEADESDPAACGDFDTSPEANAMRNAQRKKGTDGGKCKVITGRDECWETGMKPVAASSREQTWAGPSSGHTSTDDEGIFSQQEDVHQSEPQPWGEGRHVNAHQTGAISGSGDSDKVLSQPSVDVPHPGAQSLPCLPGLWDRSGPTGMAEEQSSVSGPDSCHGNEEENPSEAARREQPREEKSENPIYASGGDDGLEATVDTVEQVRKTTYERSHVSSESASVSGSQRTGEGGEVVERVQQSERTAEMVHTETRTRVTASRSVVDTVSADDIHIETPQKTQDVMVDIDSDDSLKQMQDEAKDSQDDITDDTPGTEECPTSGVDSKEIDSGDISDNDDGSSSSVGDTRLGVYTGDACGDTAEVSQVSPDDSDVIKPASDMIPQPDDETECHRDKEEPEQSPDADDECTADDTPKVVGDSVTTPCKDNHSQPATTDSDVITSEEPETGDAQRETKPVSPDSSKEPETGDTQRETKPVSPVLPVNLGERKGRSLGDLSRLDDFVAEGDMKKEGREAGRRVSRRDVHEAMRTLKQVRCGCILC